MKSPNISELVGETFTKVYQHGDDELIFENANERFVFYHEQDCCEGVYIESIVGDLVDLTSTPILFAEERTSDKTPEGLPEPSESFTWTFYTFRTIRGSVDIRWLGESNGYYSERVDLRWESLP